MSDGVPKQDPIEVETDIASDLVLLSVDYKPESLWIWTHPDGEEVKVTPLWVTETSPGNFKARE